MAIINQSPALNILKFDDTTGTLIVQSPTNNSNNLQEWRDPSGTILASSSLNLPSIISFSFFLLRYTETQLSARLVIVAEPATSNLLGVCVVSSIVFLECATR